MDKILKYTYFSLLLIALIAAVPIILLGLQGYVGNNHILTAWDELYSVREVYQILNSSSLKNFTLNIIAGNGYAYGRFMYMLDSLFACIPYWLFGLKGLIFSVRLAHTCYLILGFHLIIRLFISNWVYRLLCLGIFLVFPFTNYFAAMPKPEPLQLLLLGIFFNIKDKNWAWIFLGLALGSKVSLLFGVFFLLVFSLWQCKKNSLQLFYWAKTFGYFLLGLCIAIPGLVFALFNPYFRNGIMHIFSSSQKPYDDHSLTIFDWLKYYFLDFFAMPSIINCLFAASIFIFAIIMFCKNKKDRNYIIFSFLLLIPIMLFTKRLWGHYLFLGLILLLPLLFKFIENYINSKKIIFLSFGLSVFFILFIGKSALNTYQIILNRENTTLFINTRSQTQLAILKCLNHKKSVIGIDLDLYYQFDWYVEKSKNGIYYTIQNKQEASKCDCLILSEKRIIVFKDIETRNETMVEIIKID